MTALPDREAVAVQALKANTTISATCGGRIGTRLATTFPCIRVTLIGGSPRPTDQTGVPEFQLEFYAAGSDTTHEAQASEMARVSEGEARNLAGSYPAGRVVSSWPTAEPFHSPDPSTNRERYILSGLGLLIQP